MFYDEVGLEYHGRIKDVTHSGQLWTVAIERPPEPDYVMLFDNATFSVFYSRITGGGDLGYDLLTHGEWAIPRCLRRQRIFTSP